MVQKEIIKGFPDAPGVYLMRDRLGRVIYVGKAVSLKKRVAHYFLKNQDSLKNQILMATVEAIEYREVSSEYEALLLEDELIKKFQPRFNIIAKDDKSFPYIKVTKEEFPRVSIGRRKKGEEEVDYFGPYTSAKLLRRALTILRKVFPFCTCRRFPKRACLARDLGLCPAPCEGLISKRAYQKIVAGLADFLTKIDSDLIEELAFEMRGFVKKEEFEKASDIRDELEALSILIELKKFDRKVIVVETDFQKLGLIREPQRIEAFDISNIADKNAVGSMVSFYKGRPDKNNYRRFKIRSVNRIDDYAMIREVVRRRYERLLKESKKMPDLVVIDGGAGQLKAGRGVFDALGILVPVISIAKEHELIYTVRSRNPVRLSRDSVALRLIQRVRDEAHRFALKYHHFLRSRDAFEKA
jgi:excinuclease ABC subunit C